MNTKSVLAFIMILIMIVIVIIFTAIQGEALADFSEAVNRWILDVSQNSINIAVFSSYPEIRSMLPEYFGYAEQLENLNIFMEDAIHVFLFFMFTLAFLIFLKLTRLSLLQRMLLVLLISCLAGYGSEMLQNAVFKRGFEDRDTLNNNIGILSAAAIYLIGFFFKKGTKQKRSQSNAKRLVVVRYLSGKDFF